VTLTDYAGVSFDLPVEAYTVESDSFDVSTLGGPTVTMHTGFTITIKGAWDPPDGFMLYAPPKSSWTDD
jgi:hypothetical protein